MKDVLKRRMRIKCRLGEEGCGILWIQNGMNLSVDLFPKIC